MKAKYPSRKGTSKGGFLMKTGYVGGVLGLAGIAFLSMNDSDKADFDHKGPYTPVTVECDAVPENVIQLAAREISEKTGRAREDWVKVLKKKNPKGFTEAGGECTFEVPSEYASSIQDFKGYRTR